MKIDIICVGKLKEDYLKAASAEYIKRLAPYAKINITQLADDKNATAALTRAVEAIPYAIYLAVDGKALSSEGLALKLQNLAVNGVSHIAFVIGGATGLPAAIAPLCAFGLSLSNMTFTHQMARIIILEQIYRAFSIIAKTPYHK